jgi:Ion transport protein.
MDHKKIAKKYLKSLFWLDLLASFPYVWIANAADNSKDAYDSEGFKLVKVIRFFKLIKIVRIMRLKGHIKKIEDYLQYDSVVNGLISLLYLILIVVLMSHWCACLWHFLGKLNADNSEKSWLYQMDTLYEDVSERYIASLYWATTTMLTVGYGDYTPVSKSERVLNIVVMLIGCGLFAFAMNSIGILLQNINASVSKTRFRISSI